MMNFQELISSWHKKASKQRDCFSKFVFEYLSFIAHVKIQLYDNGTDRDAIQKFKQHVDFKEKYLSRIESNSELKCDWENVIKELDAKPLKNMSSNGKERWNCSHDRSDQRTAEERQRRKGVIHSLKDWENMIEFWYSIRNNLFHGRKDPENSRDQFVAKYGYRTLKELVELFITEH